MIYFAFFSLVVMEGSGSGSILCYGGWGYWGWGMDIDDVRCVGQGVYCLR